MKPKWNNEKELAKVLVDHFRDNGWTVYPEIYDIDIIATRPDKECKNGLKIIGIECKKHFNLTVLQQAYRRQKYVDEMFIGVTKTYDHSQQFGIMLAEMLGIGVFLLEKYKEFSIPDNRYNFLYRIDKKLESKHSDRNYCHIDRLLHEQAENFAEAGQRGGKHWTLFKKTAFLIEQYVQEHPGATIKELIENVPHHYSNISSAKSNIYSAIDNGLINVELKDGNLFAKLKKQ